MVPESTATAQFLQSDGNGLLPQPTTVPPTRSDESDESLLPATRSAKFPGARSTPKSEDASQGIWGSRTEAYGSSFKGEARG